VAGGTAPRATPRRGGKAIGTQGRGAKADHRRRESADAGFPHRHPRRKGGYPGVASASAEAT